MVLDVLTAKEILTHALNRLVEMEVNANAFDSPTRRERAYKAISGMYARCGKTPFDLQRAIVSTLKELCAFEESYRPAFDACPVDPDPSQRLLYEIQIVRVQP